MALRACSYCSASFSKVEHLKRHERTHTGEKPYTCRFCSKRFARGDVLKRHLRSHIAQDNDGDGPCSPGRASPSRRRSTSRTAADTAYGPEALVPAQDLDRYHLPVSLDASSLHMDVDSRMFQGMLTPAMVQQQLLGVGDLSSILGLPQTPASPGLSNPWDAFFLSMGSPGLSDVRSTLSRNHSLGSDIPDERFTKLARLWPKKGGPQWSLMQTLWADVASHKRANLFSEPPLSNQDNGANDYHTNDDNDYESSSFSQTNGPQTGLDDAKRQSLIQLMHSNIEADSNSEFLRSSRFPTVDTLAVCIDQYFQKFHPLFPFIHEPTFSAKHTPNILLAPICLIGLHLLNPSSTRDFVAKQILKTIDTCIVALSRTWERADWQVLVTVLGAAVLLLNYASVLEECAYATQTHTLYVRALTVALQNGLFDIARGAPLAEALTQEQRDDLFWKGWAKIESAKRLTACLVATDAIYTTKMGLKPIVPVDQLHIYAPCSNASFNSTKINRWEDVASTIKMTCIDSRTSNVRGHLTALPTPTPTNTAAMHTLLFASSLYIADLKASNNMYDPSPSENPLCLAEMSQTGTPYVPIAHLLQTIYASHSDTLLSSDPNATAIWHNMCMNLCANLNLFELAAGREGVEVGKAALEKILVWAHSPYARRACLHAAQVYVCMMRRRIADGTAFMSEIALFNAALVVGLYVYAAPDTLEGGDDAPLELLEPVDWGRVGDGGLPGWDASEYDPGCAASRFISRGAPVSFNGMVCRGGYMSSRRVILNYVGLLEEVGRWNWRKFRHILRIMSDSMVELELE